MYIEAVAIENYKSFLDRQTFQFEPGFNLLVGTNNAGKTTVLDVIDLDPNLNEPHRSDRTIPQFGGQPLNQSNFKVSLATSFQELMQLRGGNALYLPVKQAQGFELGSTNLSNEVATFIARNGQLKLHVSFRQGTYEVGFEGDEFVSGVASSHPVNSSLAAALIQYNPLDPKPSIATSNYSAHAEVSQYYSLFRQRIYRFSAQRRPGAECNTSSTNILDREAMILPYCINYLQTNDAHGHKILCAWINRVFPSVKWIQAPPTGNSFQLRCLLHPPEARRDDLSIHLSRMGSGIGNVIAILYIVLVSREPQVIAIDEPNAFLHPRALRELLTILESEGKQHQYILTAHSADVLTAVNARSISLLEFDGIVTTVTQVGLKDLHVLRGGLAELGIRMTDLHAKDRVLWVEGQTEELVMPELLRWACPEVAAGTAVLRVERTGTFSTKGIKPSEIAQIYERLSSSSALVPPIVCILLDGETRSSSERQEIERESQGKLQFLDRRMLENYLLHPEAVTATLLELDITTTPDIARDMICKALDLPDLTSDLLEIDGATVLKKVFSELSKASLEFRKTRDVPSIVAWILDNYPEHLAPLRARLRKLFKLE